jgi:uncharacterized protein YdhG (YjbR/CyaY superfamily)
MTMAEKRSAAKKAKTPARSSAGKGSKVFTDEERAAMREHAQEVKRARGGASKADEKGNVLAKIAAMQPADRVLAKRLDTLIKASAPELSSRLWYGMPAYTKDGKVVCFFQDAQKFKSRYATLGFSDQAHLDDGAMWPSAFALKELTAAGEAKIAALVKKAVS